MTKIDIISGFLGAGKTTLIKKLLDQAFRGEKVVLIENEFGEIGVDGGFMKDAGIEVTEMNSGCICCSLTGDFRAALHEVCERYAPDRILIEPSGVGKLSDIVTAVEQASDGELTINALCTVVDAGKCKMYMRNFGEFFNNQVESAGCIILSRTAGIKEEKLAECVALLREKNPGAVIITTPWDELSGAQILDAMEKRDTLTAALESIEREHEEDEDELGIKTYFCSNVCAAYRRDIYLKLGGFTKKTIFNEDMIFAGHAVEAGYQIAYAADAQVIHSHNYTAMQQLHRNFDLGVSQADHPEVFGRLHSEGEGIRLVKKTAKWLVENGHALLLPQLVMASGSKYAGYWLGKHYKKLPEGLIRSLTMNPAYWEGEAGDGR